jgi:hypothetical protein
MWKLEFRGRPQGARSAVTCLNLVLVRIWKKYTINKIKINIIKELAVGKVVAHLCQRIENWC